DGKPLEPFPLANYSQKLDSRDIRKLDVEKSQVVVLSLKAPHHQVSPLNVVDVNTLLLQLALEEEPEVGVAVSEEDPSRLGLQKLTDGDQELPVIDGLGDHGRGALGERDGGVDRPRDHEHRNRAVHSRPEPRDRGQII